MTPTLEVDHLHVVENFQEQPREGEQHGGGVGRAVFVQERVRAVRECQHRSDDHVHVDPVPHAAAPRFGEAEEGEGVVDRRGDDVVEEEIHELFRVLFEVEVVRNQLFGFGGILLFLFVR